MNLFLIPNALSEGDELKWQSEELRDCLSKVEVLFAEHKKSVFRLFSKLSLKERLDELEIVEFTRFRLNDLSQVITDLKDEGKSSFGLCSDAGCPAIADPGKEIVSIFHKRNWTVKPLVGPSSIVLSLMSSGFGGQQFSFIGYLPVKSEERKKKLRDLEKELLRSGTTFIWIEAPYRNTAVINDMHVALKPSTEVCLAVDLLHKSEIILRVKAGKLKSLKEELKGRQVIFLIGK